VPCFFLLSPTTYNYPSLSPYVSLSPTLVFVLLSLCLSLPTTSSFLLFVLSTLRTPLALCMSSTWPPNPCSHHPSPQKSMPGNRCKTPPIRICSFLPRARSLSISYEKINKPPKTYLFPYISRPPFFLQKSVFEIPTRVSVYNPQQIFPLFCVCFPFVLCSFCARFVPALSPSACPSVRPFVFVTCGFALFSRPFLSCSCACHASLSTLFCI